MVVVLTEHLGGYVVGSAHDGVQGAHGGKGELLGKPEVYDLYLL